MFCLSPIKRAGGGHRLDQFFRRLPHGVAKRARDLPSPDATACDPAPQRKGPMLSSGSVSFLFHRLSNIRREPDDRSSPFPARAVSLSDGETRSPWSSLTLPSIWRCMVQLL